VQAAVVADFTPRLERFLRGRDSHLGRKLGGPATA
jgi:hypothetical protein